MVITHPDRQPRYPVVMAGPVRSIAAVCVFCSLACGRIAPIELPPSEKWSWGEQPIRFSPAPDDWRRHKGTSGGKMGVYFVKEGSVGERLGLGVYASPARRDRCAELQDMLSKCRELTWHSFIRERHECSIDIWNPLNESEKYYGEQVKASLGRAQEALMAGDRDGVCRDIRLAREQAGRIKFELEDVVDEYMFEPGGGPVPRDRFSVSEPRPTIVANVRAIRVDYTMIGSNRMTYHGSEIYFMYNNRLFGADFHGLEENLRLFEAILDTVSFPPGRCTH
jgi:hypothetical protein